jgi:hypothetical protein
MKVGNGGQTVPGGKLEAEDEAPRFRGPAAVADRVATEPDEPPESPVMPAPPFPTFQNTPTLPQQPPGNGFESGRDSRAR